MCDCDHPKIKCMVCHRYVDSVPSTVPLNVAPAIERIKELEGENAHLRNRIAILEGFVKTIQNINLAEGDPNASL